MTMLVQRMKGDFGKLLSIVCTELQNLYSDMVYAVKQ